MKIGLFFGTFDPIHVGHVFIAQYFLSFTNLDKIVFVITPQSPFKKEWTISDKNHRLDMLRLSLNGIENLEISDIEFFMDKPNYTYLTVKKLKEQYVNDEFIIIMGEDNLVKIENWRNYEDIVNNNKIFVYNRDMKSIYYKHKNIVFFDNVPTFNISSTFLRENIKEGKNVSFFLNEKVFNYIKEQNLYI